MQPANFERTVKDPTYGFGAIAAPLQLGFACAAISYISPRSKREQELFQGGRETATCNDPMLTLLVVDSLHQILGSETGSSKFFIFPAQLATAFSSI
jgi:hypothetical protein